MDSYSYGSSSSPSYNNIDIVDYELDPVEWSLESLKNAAQQLRLARPRSLAWAILLHTMPSPEGDILTSVNSHREFYNDLKARLCTDPREVIDDDPLSQNEQSAWKRHFCDNELKALIMQDVVRTFPDELYFRDKDVQHMMVRILFFWARSHSYVGYRQGMHEILAPLLFELFQDRRFAPKEISETLKCILDDDYLEHDSYALFCAVMRGLERFYTTGETVPNANGRLPQSNHLHNPNEVVRYLHKVKEEYLVPLDSELASHLTACNISMELFGIRWLRLLFGREFHHSEIPDLWGFLFADGPTMPHIHFVVLAMLISIREELLGSDAGGGLSVVMRGSPLPAAYVARLARHLRDPSHVPRPPPPPTVQLQRSSSPDLDSTWSLEQAGTAVSAAEVGAESGVVEGGDLARELAALAVLRARLPPAAACLAAALPRAPPRARRALHTLAQLSALLQCRNHALMDVETALEAAEGDSSEQVGQRQIVPVSLAPPAPVAPKNKLPQKIKEVPLKLFYQAECDSASDLPFLDPLRLRTE